MRDDAQRMQDTLTDPALTSVQVVTLPEEMAVTEAMELVRRVQTELELPLGRVFLNAHVAPRLSPAQVEVVEALVAAGGRAEPASAAAHAGVLHARRAARSERYRDLLTQRLPALPLTLVPHLHAPSWGRAQIETLSRALETGGLR
jgi:anion-transporting  ArsA/GET3 family ATPase